MKVSIVIPALNEEKTVGLCVRKALEALRRLELDGEVLVADNGSTDRTRQAAAEAGARVVDAPARGYGHACQAGFTQAAGDVLVMGDADDSYDFREIGPFLDKIREGYDFVVGNRFRGRIEPGAMPALHRYLGTPVLTFLDRLFFGSRVGDVNCGLRALTRSAFEALRLRSAGMEFASEMIIKASLLGLRVTEVPCNLYRDKRSAKPHLRTWRDGWRNLRFLLLFTPEWTFLGPGLVLSAVGSSAMVLLTARHACGFDGLTWLSSKHMLSGMLAWVVGAQIIWMGLAAEAFSFTRYFDRRSRTFRFLVDFFSLEKGVVAGLALIAACGLIFGYLFASYYWGVFPRLSDELRLDIAVWALTGSILGVQTVYSSFLISLFYLKTR